MHKFPSPSNNKKPPPPTQKIDTYQKHTTTDKTINYLSNHHTQHKIAAYRYHINGMQSVSLTTERQQTEWNTLKTWHKTITSHRIS
jgi:hypothetical protein